MRIKHAPKKTGKKCVASLHFGFEWQGKNVPWKLETISELLPGFLVLIHTACMVKMAST
jgi:hypothetical protein